MGRYVIIFLCLANLHVFAQGSKKDHIRAVNYYEKAKISLSKTQYEDAIKHLQQSLQYDPSFAEAHQQLADIYRKQEKYETASIHYAEVIKINPNLTPYSFFGYAESLFLSGNYSEALPQFTLFLEQKSITQESRIKTKKYVKDCLFSIKSKAEPQSIILENMGDAVNTKADEYFPMLTADRTNIIFTRKENNQENFFQSNYSDKSGWQEATLLSAIINSKNFNEGAHTVSADGNYLFFTGCNRPDGLGSCDIYVSKRENETWSTPFRLPEPINSSSWEAQPSISADGKTLYFVSNRKGGSGGTDIWKSTVSRNGEWGTAENLGPAINTPYNESSPSIHADTETLYFASDGWPGFGKNDLFFSKKDTNGIWNTPINLGYPINDFAEQRSISVSFLGDVAYMASKLSKSDAGLDIFTFTLPKSLRPKPVAFVKGTVVDERTGKPIAAKISLTKLSEQKKLFDDYADQGTGTFLAPLPFGFQYALQVMQPGYLFYSAHYALEDSSMLNHTFDIKIRLKPIAIGKTVTLNNVFFPIDQFEILQESQTDLALLLDFLRLNKSIKIEIAGHTDGTGSAEHNLKLSEKRAQSIYNYLIENQINPERLSYHGYGPEKPIANNNTEEGRAKNRRTEFRIIETH